MKNSFPTNDLGSDIATTDARSCRGTPRAALAWRRCVSLLVAVLLLPTAAVASAAPPILTRDEAYARDGAVYARQFGIGSEEGARRLRALHESAAQTDAIRRQFAARLAGISIDHAPTLRIDVLLTGDTQVAPTVVRAAGIDLPVHFRTGARASADDVSRAMLQRAAEIRAVLPDARGMGLDARTGDLVILIGNRDAARADLALVRARAEAAAGVPVRLDRAQQVEDHALAGGVRVEGSTDLGGRRYFCTTGFAVTDGVRAGIATAAHCPDLLDYRDPDGERVSLAFAGQWGARTQDVQVNIGPAVPLAAFYADRPSNDLRALGGARSRLSTRAGEWLCHYGESSGYSCSEVELVNFAPPGALCAGPCAPTWVSVRTSDCRRGDSGGPVFAGDVAFGITKGGSGTAGARCNFYFYMSTDFLPAGWSLLRQQQGPGQEIPEI